MKKNNLILATAVALYSLLFYQQSPGINFLLFSLALVVLLLIRNTSLLKNKLWLCAAIGSLLSGACLAYSGNTLSLIANIVSLGLLSVYSLYEGSLVFALLHALFSYSSSLFFVFVDRLKKKQEEIQEGETTASSPIRKITLVVIPVLIAVVFFFMYRGSNVLFNEFAKKINLDFISMNWIAFTLGGFILLYGFFHSRQISIFATYDQKTGNTLEHDTTSTAILFGKKLSISDESFSGIVLFILLNVLLLIVNVLDINFLFIDGKLPAGLTYSEFVHQGTGMLITSILAGILIILFYFRGAMNFYERNSVLKLLAFLWIVQNVCMLFSTSMRNNMYISEYGLTYKRIGVYAYLILTVIGLCTTLIKIGKTKSNMYLFRINSWLFYGALILCCFVNWDSLITNYNIHTARQLEKKYLAGLSYANLPQLYELRADSIHKHKEFVLEESEILSDTRSYNSTYDFESSLNRKLFMFVHKQKTADWRSLTFLGHQVISNLEKKNVYKTITNLQLNGCSLSSLEGLENFSSLKSIYLYNNELTSIKGIENLRQLEELNLGSNPLTDYTPLYKLKNLKQLYVPANEAEINKLKQQLPNTHIN